MKKIFAILAWAAISLPLIPRAQPARGSAIRTETIRSAILGADKTFSVYLPAGYETSGLSYPVLYLLHGASDTHTAWLEKGNMRTIVDQAISAGISLPLIVVMPDASGLDENHTGKNMGYFNQEGWAYEDHFFKEFIPHVEKSYRIVADKAHRAVAGLSMGGGGSAGYALLHPDMFSSACPLSGALGGMSRPTRGFSPVQFLRDATPEQLEAIRSVRWFIDCGDDDFLAGANVAMYTLMHEKNVPLQYRMRDGAHNWLYWQQSLPEVLKFISTGFSEQK